MRPVGREAQPADCSGDMRCWTRAEPEQTPRPREFRSRSALRDLGHVEVDDRKEKVNLKIREAQLQKVPYMLVVGDREAQNDSVSVRNRKHGDQGVKRIDDFLADIKQLIDTKAPSE